MIRTKVKPVSSSVAKAKTFKAPGAARVNRLIAGGPLIAIHL